MTWNIALEIRSDEWVYLNSGCAGLNFIRTCMSLLTMLDWCEVFEAQDVFHCRA